MDKDMKCCATCRHHTALGKPNAYQCIGCLIEGECTKWEDAGGKDDDE